MVKREDIRSAYVLAGYDYWLAKQRTLGDPARLPARRDFDPLIEATRLAPHMMLKDVQRDPLDFRYRLIGSAIRHHMARDMTGVWQSQVPFQRPGSTVWDNSQLVTEERQPLLARPPYVGPHNDILYIESIILPLANDGHNVDMLMFFVDFLGPDGTSR